MWCYSYRIQFVLEDQSQSCVIPYNANEHRLTNNTNAQDNTYVGLRVNNLAVAFRYVAVYKF